MEKPPAWAAALLAALMPVLVVLGFNDLEHAVGRAMGSDSGPELLLAVVGLFVLAWAPAVPILARCDAPAQGGAWAGTYVAAAMGWQLAPLLEEFGPFIIVVGALFASLAFALALLAGGLAAKGPAWTGAGAVGLGLLLALLIVPFMPTRAPMAWAWLVPAAITVAGALLWWRGTRAAA